MSGSHSEYHTSIRWRHSIVFRVIVMCAVLVCCLLGAVYVLTHHYYGEVVREMEAQAQAIADDVVVNLEENPDLDFGELEYEVRRRHKGVESFDLDLNPPATEMGPTRVSIEVDENGELTQVARHTFVWNDQPVLLTTRAPLATRAHVVEAFKNMYLLGITGLFLGTIILMVYFIIRILRPLRQLTDSCAKISEGWLEDVEINDNAGEIRALEDTFNQMVTSLREKELMEGNLRQAQRLSALGNLAAGIAHDVRNPLNAIKLITSHALDKAEQESPGAGTSKQLHSIRREVDRLEDIVSGFLSLARESELDPRPNQVDTLLDECVHLVKKDAESRGVRLTTELRAGDTTLMLDSKQWTRAILNVLINALEATPQGGRVRLFSRVSDQECEIEIRDDGPGLSGEIAERIFEPYYTTKSTGTGLGLAVTRGIVEEHGGSIHLSGEEGQGCQVLITIPLNESTVAA